MRLSLHDSDNLGDKYVDEPELWLKTEKLVRKNPDLYKQLFFRFVLNYKKIIS